MAKKQKVDEPEIVEEIISVDDAIAEEKQRIEDEQITEFLGEEVKDGKIKEEEPEIKEDEVVEEEPKEEIAEEPKIDPDALKKEIKEEVSKETADKITQALTGKEEATKAEKDKYQEYADKFMAEKGRNPTWFEFVPFLKEEVKEELKADQERVIKEQQESKAAVDEQNAQRTAAFNKHIDAQLEDLYKANKLPKIVNKDDKNDVGVQARQALFKSMLEVNQDRTQKGLEPIYSLKEIFYEHYKAPNTQPAGADAPISAGGGSTNVESPEDYSYNEISNKSFLDFFKK